MSDVGKIFLLPGEMHFSKKPVVLSTLLGSCVAVCLHDPTNGWGGMNHYMVPDSSSTQLEAGKCGDQAIAQLLRLARMAGAGTLQARIAGGGAVIGMLSGNGAEIGQRNIERALVTLSREGIPVVQREVGGTLGRRIEFNTATGALHSRSIERSEAAERRDKLARRKARVLVVDDSPTVRRLLVKAIEGDATLEVCGEAENPFQARELLLACEPDVICLDVIMPGLDGLTFLRRIMQFRPLPVVIVSTVAKAGSEMERKLREAGAVAVFDKEGLSLLQGLDTARSRLLPVLHRAAATIVHARPAAG